MTISEKFHESIEARVGLSIEQIKSYSPEKLRSYLEKRNRKIFSFTVEFPIIGRKNNSFVTTEELNKEIDRILK